MPAMAAFIRILCDDYARKIDSDHIHMLASSPSLGKLSWQRQFQPCRLQKHVQALVQHTVREAQAGKVGPRALANVAYGAARCGRSAMLSLLFAVLARAVERRLIELNLQEIANTAWAFATVECPFV